MTKQELAKKIDHTLLRPDATYAQIDEAIMYAQAVGAASVCLNAAHARRAAQLLRGSDTAVCCVVGFPLGASCKEAKAYEAALARACGASELDMVMDITAAKDGRWDIVSADIKAVVDASPADVKVILETCYLNNEEIISACRAAKEAGARFVKTSTGFGPSGAKAEAVRLMRATVGAGMGVKAAGGIATLADVLAMLDAGASRIGLSRTQSILEQLDS